PAPPEPAAAAPPPGRPRFYTIFFDWDSDEINPVAQRVVDTIAEDWLADQATMSLVGHTDRSGSDDYNQKLSEERVDAVTESLVIEGFGPARISGYGVGETDPIVPTADGEREQRNRRVVVTVAE
ncbi:MAG: OmpA family protein, partial [Alphaproteobacteria bacterium]|nr:OmpA family protein [Alphaproteobacteria bacterium]